MKVFEVPSGLIIAAVLTASTDGSAAGTVDRDISGQGIEFSEWRRIGVETLVIDVSGLGAMRISKAPERGQNNRIVRQRAGSRTVGFW